MEKIPQGNPTKLKLHGFNNLTKSLSFNLYDLCYARTVEDRDAYIEYIDEQYNAERLTTILESVNQIIGATILSISKQDYDPQGSSVTILICEEEQLGGSGPSGANGAPGANVTPGGDGPSGPTPPRDTILAHLDKSHITVHTYPEYHPVLGISTFRIDIDVSTCGRISPLNALDYLIHSFDADIMTIDYRVRGFTRDFTGKKLFIDHPIHSIQSYLPQEIHDSYHMMDVNVYQENIFHTKCMLRAFDLDNYLFGTTKAKLHAGEKRRIEQRIHREMEEIYYGRNFSSM